MSVHPLRAASVNEAVLHRLLDLNNAAVPAVGEVDLARLRHLLHQSPIAFVVADDEGPDDGVSPDAQSLIGFCLVMGPAADYDSVNFTWFAERYEQFIYLDRVVVDPAHHGRGHGRALYEQVITEAAVLMPEAEQFCLEVNLRPRNDQSLAFHDRLGFTEVGQQETPYGVRVSMMTRPLSTT